MDKTEFEQLKIRLKKYDDLSNEIDDLLKIKKEVQEEVIDRIGYFDLAVRHIPTSISGVLKDKLIKIIDEQIEIDKKKREEI